MKKLFCFLLVIVTVSACSGVDEAESQPANQNYEVETVLTGIPSPWGMTWLPDGALLITNRNGELRLYKNGTLVKKPINNVPEVWAKGQGGLMDILRHPDYQQNGWLYITYSSPEGGEGANTALMRARLNDDRTALIDKKILYKAEPNTNRGQHFGSRITFDDEGYLYFSVGDRGNRDQNPQDISRDGGKIYRLNPDGSIPEGNPFVNQEGAKKAIFSYGHRNPQGMDKHPETGKIWIHEHGPRGGDEVNKIEKGANYGWPILSFGINYSGTEFAEDTARAGMNQPEWYWDPSIAPSGMTFVTGDQYPDWQGDLLVGSLKFSYIVLCNVEDDTITNQTILFKDIGRVRNIKQGPNGYIHVATEGNGIVRIVPDK